MLVSLTVGKVDAGVAVLLTDDNRLIEFPSVLLPKNINSGSIVDITVSRNFTAEAESAAAFRSLQKRILNTYGINSPSPPVLRLRNATQTSLVLEWDPINLATASLKSLSLYRNGAKAGSIPRPTEMLSTKISGLAIDTEYTFHLVLRTSAGTFSSEKLTCRTHKMTDLSGITITPGVLPPAIRTSLAAAVDRVGAKLIDNVRIDTTHFVCTEGRGPAWEKAVEMNIPVVRPEWIEGCEREGTIVSVRGYYLNADPKTRQIGQGAGLPPASHMRSASSTVSGGRESQSQSNLSPRPGSENATKKPLPAAPNGTDTDDAETEVPPTPPPKTDGADLKEQSSKAEDDAEDAEDSEDDDVSDDNEQNKANGDDGSASSATSSESESTQEKEPKGPNETHGSQPPQPSTTDTSVDESQRIGKNDNSTEGVLDEVPL